MLFHCQVALYGYDPTYGDRGLPEDWHISQRQGLNDIDGGPTESTCSSVS